MQSLTAMLRYYEKQAAQIAGVLKPVFGEVLLLRAFVTFNFL
jgi:hypothetical protein